MQELSTTPGLFSSVPLQGLSCTQARDSFSFFSTWGPQAPTEGDFLRNPLFVDKGLAHQAAFAGNQ